MLKNIILILVCLILVVSCGRKNDPQYEVSFSYGEMILLNSDKVLKIF